MGRLFCVPAFRSGISRPRPTPHAGAVCTCLALFAISYLRKFYGGNQHPTRARCVLRCSKWNTWHQWQRARRWAGQSFRFRKFYGTEPSPRAVCTGIGRQRARRFFEPCLCPLSAPLGPNESMAGRYSDRRKGSLDAVGQGATCFVPGGEGDYLEQSDRYHRQAA